MVFYVLRVKISYLDMLFLSFIGQTKSDHVKSNLVHKLHRIRAFGIFLVIDFGNLVYAYEYKRNEKNKAN